jgi:Cu+-exporting ATPase
VSTPTTREPGTVGTEESRDPLPARETVVSLAIAGMTCGACAARIERRLNDLDGVTANVNYASERARVTLLADRPLPTLIREIESLGYSAQVAQDSTQGTGDAAEVDRRARSLGRRLVVAALLFMPLCDLSIAFSLVPRLRFPYWQWVLIVLAMPVLTWGAWPFYKAAVRNARHGTSSMDTLVSLGIVAATGWSLYAMFWRDTSRAPRTVWFVLAHQSGGAIYIDVAVGVTSFLLAGRYFEAWSKRRTGNALRSLAAVGAKDVSVLDATGVEHRLPLAHLAVGDQFVVRPGETIAADGEIVFGHSAIDRSAMTGESLPLDVVPGDSVAGGTVAVGGRLVVKATKVGLDTQLAHMIQLVENAQNQKAAVQRLADRIAAVFVPAVLVISLLTFAAWLLVDGVTEQAFNAALCVLIIACPCALGLATPTALLVASGQGARLGIFFKGYLALEASRQVDTVVLDKTGTVTEGRMAVTDVQGERGVERATLLRWAGALEQASEHLVARAIAAAAEAELGTLPAVHGFEAEPGIGARGTVDGHQIAIGKFDLFATCAAEIPGNLAARFAEWESMGRTAVLVGRDDAIVGVIAVADTIRPSAAGAIQGLRALGLHCILLSGDNEPTARAVGGEIGVTDVVADALPGEKVAVIRRLQDEGRSVAMVGDGINDGPSLVCADLGLAVGSGTDVAINAADLIIVRDDLGAVVTAIDLARRTLKTIRGNLVWAFAYNVAAIPLAASGFLNPLIAAAAMALSSGFVVWNSSRLRHAGGAVPEYDSRLSAAGTTGEVKSPGTKGAGLGSAETVPTPKYRSDRAARMVRQ